MSENERDKEGIKHVMSTRMLESKTCLRRKDAQVMSDNEWDKEGIKHVLSMNVKV